jgi:hypothetical protein
MYGHTPLPAAEDIPWQCRRLVIGTGAYGALPEMRQVRQEARRCGVDLGILPTAEGDRRAERRHGRHQRRPAPELLTRPAPVLDGTFGPVSVPPARG